MEPYGYQVHNKVTEKEFWREGFLMEEIGQVNGQTARDIIADGGLLFLFLILLLILFTWL